MNKQEVKDKLQEAYTILLDCDIAIAELNEDGKQFDYCTDPKLSDITDRLVKRVKSIEQKVYQE